MDREIVEKDLAAAVEIIDKGQLFCPRFMTYAPCYLWSTKNLTDYYSKLDFKGKDVLSVASCGDHAFNAYLMGANFVETFDVNRLQRYVQELKRTAIKTLDHDTFIQYLNQQDYHQLFSKEIYQQLRGELPSDVRYFWDTLYGSFTSYILASEYFLEEPCATYSLNGRNPYTNREQYQKAKEVLKEKEIPFLESDLLSLPKVSHLKTYDIILLSNIAQYVLKRGKEDNKQYQERKEEFYRTISSLVNDHLNPKGIVVTEYLYPSIYRSRKFELQKEYRAFLPDVKMRTLEIKRYLEEGKEKTDHVVILQKKR